MAGPTGKEPLAEAETLTSGKNTTQTSLPPARKPQASKRPPPAKIGRYTVERLLGQGGMGRVWLARDTVLGRKVAIKVLRDDLSLPPSVYDELVIRMGHEARAAAAVSHPNIVTLHDMGEDDVVGLFLVFEYVTTKTADIAAGSDDGVVLSLRDRLKEGSLPFSELAKLAQEVGGALSFAHEAGVIHRDVKPENILFSRTGFKIADFGIARIPDSTITRTNTILGTPAYTAPEALSKGDFSPASDQFSLAATLYEAATGARAFGGEDAIATAGKVSSEPPPPLQERMGTESVVRLLDQVLQRGLAKLPEHRFSSCADLGQEVARAIERARQARSAEGRPGSDAEPPRLTSSGRPAPLGTPAPGLLEIERTPLSSRARVPPPSLLAAITAANGSETPRPSVFARRQTQRFQNIAAGVAILVIIVLVLLGRRTPNADGANAAASASAPTSAPAQPAAPNANATAPKKPKHAPPHATASTSAASPSTEAADVSPAPAEAD